MANKISSVVNTTKDYIVKHSPAILVGVGVTGMIGSTILAVKATPKALKLIEESKEEWELDKLSKKQVFKLVWKLYLPAAITTVASAGCIIGSCVVNDKRNAALATAYSLSERAFRTYRDEVISTIGEKKEQELRNSISQKEVEKDKPDSNTIILTSKGNTLCKDTISGRYFRSDIDTIKKICNEANRRLLTENYISLNEFYDLLGLDKVKDGDYIGWNVGNGFIEVSFDACISPDDEPCIVMDYNDTPQPKYNTF